MKGPSCPFVELNKPIRRPVHVRGKLYYKVH